MSSINPGFNHLPIASSAAGSSSAGKNSTTDKTAQADAGAATTVEAAQVQNQGLAGSEKSSDRDADGRQLYDEPQESPSGTGAPKEKPNTPPRSQDPQKLRGNQLDLDA